MRRHSLPAAPRPLRASGDRWLFGYADIVTLLFACFASLYAAEAVRPVATVKDVRLPAPVVESAAHVTTPLERDLQTIAARHVSETNIEVASNDRGLVLSLAEAGSFPPGRADLTPAARAVMLTIADALSRVSNLVRVEGHTDDSPIRNGIFQTNWELSTTRATRVVQFLTASAGLDPGRFAAVGYAEFRPRVPNDSPAARARNRRVDIVVLGVDGAPEAR